MKSKEQYTLTVVGVPGYSAPLIIRLRRFLKMALRSYGLRVVRIESASGDDDDNQTDRETA